MTALAIVLVGLGIVTLTWAAHIALYSYSYSERGRAKKDRLNEMTGKSCEYPNTCPNPKFHETRGR